MENLGIYALGFAGQAMFGGRLTIQWWLSERKGVVVSPSIYWYLSLGGAAVFLVYGLLRSDPVIIIGQTASYYIYIRNLQLKNEWHKLPSIVRALILGLLPATFIYFGLFGSIRSSLEWSYFTDPMMILGTVGQLALNLRFIYQWRCSEKAGVSTLPIGFWHISVWASAVVILYSVFHPINGFDLVLFVSQTLGIVVYIRNLILARKAESRAECTITH